MAGQWEPDESRGSRPVLRERRGEIPLRHSPLKIFTFWFNPRGAVMSVDSDIIHRYREAIHEFLAAWDDWPDERLIPARLAEALGTLRSMDANPGPQDV
jgi:hypothetical protein